MFSVFHFFFRRNKHQLIEKRVKRKWWSVGGRKRILRTFLTLKYLLARRKDCLVKWQSRTVLLQLRNRMCCFSFNLFLYEIDHNWNFCTIFILDFADLGGMHGGRNLGSLLQMRRAPNPHLLSWVSFWNSLKKFLEL